MLPLECKTPERELAHEVVHTTISARSEEANATECFSVSARDGDVGGTVILVT